MLLYGCLQYDENIRNINEHILGKMSGKDVETIAGTAKGEYLPKKAYENRFYIATRDEKIDLLEGKAVITNEEKNGVHYKANIATGDTDYAIMELPYIYYPGYEARLDGMIIDTFETEHGFVGIIMGKEEKAELEVNYVGTRIMKVSLFISFISFIALCVYIWKKH